MWYLRDPLRLTHYQIIMPQALAPLLMLLDGQRDEQGIHEAFCQQVGDFVDRQVVREALAKLDEACLLENERSAQAKMAQLAAYRALPHRPPALAGISYPADIAELTATFRRYGQGDQLNGTQPWTGRALISPHIDYMRGGRVYARVWRRAQAAVAEADLVLIFGTDHNGGGLITLTRQAYATPFGTLPAAPDLVQKLAEAYGEEAAFANELNHRDEHSIELSAVWLHYVFEQLGQAPCPVVPILCGSFAPFVSNGHHPANDKRLNAFVETLRRETAGKRVLAVASVDFAHVGPQFGDFLAMDAGRRERLRQSDKSLMAAVGSGDHARFYHEIAAVQDRNRICGFSSIYTMLRYLDGPGSAPLQGIEVAYEHCPADEKDESLVSICGMLLT